MARSWKDAGQLLWLWLEAQMKMFRNEKKFHLFFCYEMVT